MIVRETSKYFYSPSAILERFLLSPTVQKHLIAKKNLILFFPLRNSPWWARTSSVSRLYNHTHTPYCVGLLWTSVQPNAETTT